MHRAQWLWRRASAAWRASCRGDRALEERFHLEELARCRWGLRVFCWFAIALLVASAVSSYVDEPDLFPTLLVIRLVSMALLAGVVLLLRSTVGRRRPRELAIVFVLILGLTFHALALVTGGQASPQYDRMNLVVLGLPVLITWSPMWATLACATMVAVYVGGTATSGQSFGSVAFAHNLIRLIAASAITVAATALQERQRWRAALNAEALANAQEQSRETQERYQLLVDTAGSAIVALSVDRRILEFNREAEAMYGWQRHEVLGQDYFTLFLPEERRTEVAAIMARALAGEAVRGFEAPVRARTGERRVVLWNITRLGTAARPLGVIAVGQDITARKHAEEESRRLNEELENRVLARTADLRTSEERVRQHQEQLAHVLRVSTMGEMTAALAHELNQPLGAIVNFANGGRPGLDDPVYAYNFLDNQRPARRPRHCAPGAARADRADCGRGHARRGDCPACSRLPPAGR